MLEVLLAIRLYLSQRGIIARLRVSDTDIDDEIDWIIYDTATVADHNNELNLITQFKDFTIIIDMADDGGPVELGGLVFVSKTKLKRNKVLSNSMVSKTFDIRSVEAMQKIYEFITSRN